jgi:hypothetical protein
MRIGLALAHYTDKITISDIEILIKSVGLSIRIYWSAPVYYLFLILRIVIVQNVYLNTCPVDNYVINV